MATLPLTKFFSPSAVGFPLRPCLALCIFAPPPTALIDMSLNPDFGPHDRKFPPLPEIKDAAIRQRVFTHRSLHGRPTHIFEDPLEDLSPDNEKYEHLGDTVISLTVTSLMMNLYPGLRVGPSTKIRAMIVGNSNLAEISLKYQLPRRLLLNTSQAIALRASATIQGKPALGSQVSSQADAPVSLADVFESFVGGLYLDQGLDVVKRWLDQLFSPYAKAAYTISRLQHGLPSAPLPLPFGRRHQRQNDIKGDITCQEIPAGGHLALFNQCLQKGHRRVEWRFSDGRSDIATDQDQPETLVLLKQKKATPVWCATVFVDNEVYGQGKGTTKQVAKNEAAKQGLDRLGIVDVV